MKYSTFSVKNKVDKWPNPSYPRDDWHGWTESKLNDLFPKYQLTPKRDSGSEVGGRLQGKHRGLPVLQPRVAFSAPLSASIRGQANRPTVMCDA